MSYTLFKHDRVELADRLELHNTIERGEFDPLVIHNPEIELKHHLNVQDLAAKDILFLTIGQTYNICITVEKNLIYWKNAVVSSEKVDAVTSQSLKRRSFLGDKANLFTKSIDVIAKFASKKEKEGLVNVKQLYANKNGDFALIVADKAVIAFMPEINELRVIEKNMSEEINCVNFIEEFSADQLTVNYKFFMGTLRGTLIFGKVLVRDKTKRSENYITETMTKVTEFHIAENQVSIINGISAFHSDSRNFLILSVDKRLMLLTDFSSFESLAQHFGKFRKNSRVIFESDFIYNKFYAVEGYMSYTFNAFVLNNNGIFMVTLNLQNGEAITEELPIFLDYDKEVRTFSGRAFSFHPFNYHYALAFENEVLVMSMLSKDVAFKHSFDAEKILYCTVNPNNNNMMMNVGKELYELRVLNDMPNSWIHLVNHGLTELAYYTTLNYDISYKEKVGKLLAHQYFDSGRHTEAIEMFFKSREDFELVVAKLNGLDGNSGSYFKALVGYLRMKLAETEKLEEPHVRLSKQKILTTLLLETLSYKYMQARRLLEIKTQRGDINLNIEVSEEDLNLYTRLLSELINEYYSVMNESVVAEVLQQHGNFYFSNYYAEKRRNYYDILHTSLSVKDYGQAIVLLKDYYKHLSGLSGRRFEEESKVFSDLLEIWGESLFTAKPKDFKALIVDLFKVSNIKALSAQFFRKCLAFVARRYPDDEIKEVLSHLVS